MTDRGLLEGIFYLSQKVATYAPIKFLIASMYVALAYLFDPLQAGGLIALLVLIVADFLTGIAASYKTGADIKSRKIFVTVIKIVVYFSMIALANVAEHAVPIMEGLLDETTLGFLAITELISNLENFGRMGYLIPQKMLNQLKDFQSKK